MSRLPHVIALVVFALAGCPAPDDDAGEGEGEGEGEGDAGEGEGEGEGEGDGAGACPYDTFSACGGDVVGAWAIDAFCPPEGQSLSQPCDGSFVQAQPACADNAAAGSAPATCTQQYGGSVTFDVDGTGTLANSIALTLEETLAAPCLAALGGDCASLSEGERLCADDGGACACFTSTPFGSETIEVTWTSDAAGLHVDTGLDPWDGPYCVDGDGLVVTNALGWPFWLLSRP